jgi:hypothetical protein
MLFWLMFGFVGFVVSVGTFRRPDECQTPNSLPQTRQISDRKDALGLIFKDIVSGTFQVVTELCERSSERQLLGKPIGRGFRIAITITHHRPHKPTSHRLTDSLVYQRPRPLYRSIEGKRVQLSRPHQFQLGIIHHVRIR